MTQENRNDGTRFVVGRGAPRPHERKIHVLKIRPGNTYNVLLVNWRTKSILVHWDGQRDVPHTEPATECGWCQMGWKPRWSGWVGGWLTDQSRYVLVPITSHAVHTCPALDTERGEDLRGRWLTMRRIGSKHNSPVGATLGMDRVSAHLVPEELDVLAAVAIHFGLDPKALQSLDDAGGM